MAEVASLMVRLNADVSGFESNMNKATRTIDGVKNKLEGISKRFKSIGKGMEDVGKSMNKYITLPLVTLGGIAVKTGMTYESSINQINRTLGGSSSIIEDFAKNNALAFNMSEKAAVKYGATYSNLLSSFIDEQKDNANLTEILLRQSAVVASWTGRSIEDTMERIRSGLLGSTEAIEDLGINVNISMLESTEAFRKFANGKSWNQLSFQTQQQIRLFAILEQSVDKYGTAINKTKFDSFSKLRAQLENIAVLIGNELIPIISDFIDKYIMPAVNAFKNMDEETRKSVVNFLLFAAAIGPVLTILGKLTGGVGGVVKIAGSLGGKLLGLGGAAAKATGGMKGLSGAFGAVASHPVVAAIVALIGLLTYLYFTNEEVKEGIQNAWSELKDFLGKILTFMENEFRNAWDTIVNTLKNAVKIIENIFGALNALIEGDWADMWKHLGDAFMAVLSIIGVAVLNVIDGILWAFQKLAEIIVDKVFLFILEKWQGLFGGMIDIANAGIKLLTLGKVEKAIEYEFKPLEDTWMPSDYIKKAREEVGKVTDKLRGGEKAELPFIGGEKSKTVDTGWSRGLTGGWNNRLNNTTSKILPRTEFIRENNKDKIASITDGWISPINEVNDYYSEYTKMWEKMMKDMDNYTNLDKSKNAVDRLQDSIRELVSAFRQQADAFADSLGLFDKFERKNISSARLMNRLKSQVKAMNDWSSNLTTLQNRGVSEGMLNDLRGMGVQSVDYIKALAQMSDAQLAEYQSLYGQKYNVAQKEAERMVMTEQKIQNYTEKQIDIHITGNNISNQNDVRKLANDIIRELKLRGV